MRVQIVLLLVGDSLISPEQITIHADENVFFKCHFKYRVSWLQNGNKIQKNAKPLNNALMIYKVSLSNKGIYHCIARVSNIGEWVAHAILYVIGRCSFGLL